MPCPAGVERAVRLAGSSRGSALRMRLRGEASAAEALPRARRREEKATILLESKPCVKCCVCVWTCSLMDSIIFYTSSRSPLYPGDHYVCYRRVATRAFTQEIPDWRTWTLEAWLVPPDLSIPTSVDCIVDCLASGGWRQAGSCYFESRRANRPGILGPRKGVVRSISWSCGKPRVWSVETCHLQNGYYWCLSLML